MAEITITKDNFDEVVLKSNVPVLIDFWATWCGPCRMLGPILSKAAEAYEGKIVVGKVNVDEEGELAQKFGVNAIPLVLGFKNGEKVTESLGLVPYENLEAMIKEML